MKESTTRLEDMLKGTGDLLKARAQNVCDYLLANEDRLQDLTISEISIESGVSKATVVRFCKALGFNGLKDFKVWYEAGKGASYSEMKPIDKESSTEEVISSLKTGFARSVDATYTEENLQKIQTLIAHMEEASSIAIAAEGECVPFAEILASSIKKAYPEKTCCYYDDALQSAEAAGFCLAVSFSGTDRSVMNYLSSVVLSGGEVDVFTCNATSLLAKVSSLSLLVENEDLCAGTPYLLGAQSFMAFCSYLSVLLAR